MDEDLEEVERYVLGTKCEETRKQTVKEIFADLEAEQLHICGNWRLHKIPEECMGEEVIAKLKKKYLGDVTFLKKKAQPKKVKK